MCHTVSLGVPSLTVSLPAQVCSGGVGSSRPNQFDFAALDPLCRKTVSGIILGLLAVLF